MLNSLLLLALQVNPEFAEVRNYRARLETPGGELRFDLDLARTPDAHWRAFLINGAEHIEIPRVTLEAGQLLLDMPHYDSRIRATVSTDARALDGFWEKRRTADSVASLPFHALSVSENARDVLPPTPSDASWQEYDLTGRWLAQFETDALPSVAVFAQEKEALSGTFLTATGDYRYLAGRARLEGYAMPNECPASTKLVFELSCFDGAHAFLFKGELDRRTTPDTPSGTIRGDFWSGNWHHETWTAKRDDSAELADPFAQTKWNGTTKLADLSFPDLDGKSHSLGEFAGKATLLVVLGSWCPNCNDEAELLKELDAKYKERGLRILGLAFELTGEAKRDAEQVRIFAKRHELALPFFLCGTADKDEATKALGLVDRVRAFPTTIFVGPDGLPKAIHSGFAGPATGEEHAKLVHDFEARIEALLGAK